MEGTLTAELHGETRRCKVESIGGDTFDLTMAAIGAILKRAKDSKIWARGAIVLKDDTGTVLHTMAAKE